MAQVEEAVVEDDGENLRRHHQHVIPLELVAPPESRKKRRYMQMTFN